MSAVLHPWRTLRENYARYLSWKLAISHLTVAIICQVIYLAGAVLLLLSWMYYSMVVVLAGGELNAELAKGTGEIAPEPKTEYDKKVAAAQTERAREDQHEERKKEQKEVRSNAKREEVAKGADR